MPLLDAGNGATLDWTLGTTPTSWGSAPTGRPTVLRRRNPAGDRLPVQPAGHAGAGRHHHRQDRRAEHDRPRTDRHRARLGAIRADRLASDHHRATFDVPPNGSGTDHRDRARRRGHPADVLHRPGIAVDRRHALPGLTPDRPGRTAAAACSPRSTTRDIRRLRRQRGQLRRRRVQLLRPGAGNRRVDPGPAGHLRRHHLHLAAPTPGYPDNVIAAGQQITVNAPAGTQQLGFLGSATSGPSQGLATLTYSDGSTAQYWLGLSDWTLNGGGRSHRSATRSRPPRPIATAPAAPAGATASPPTCSPAPLPVDPAKTLTSVTLPTVVDSGPAAPLRARHVGRHR